MPAKMLHMCVGASDLDRSERFYHDALGLEVKDRYPSEEGWTVSFLANAEATMELELVTWVKPGLRYGPPGQDVHVGVCVEDIEAEHARLSRIASRIEPITTHWHEGKPFSRYFFAADPDGNWIEFIGRTERYR